MVEVELRELKYFKTVAEFGSMAKAASALHMTQPTLSRQIAQLERRLGHRLLRRSPRGTALTPAGEGLLAHVGIVFQQVDRIPEVLHTFAQTAVLIHLGLPQGMPHTWFERFRRSLAHRSPWVRLSLHEGTSQEQREWLQAGLLDLGLLHFSPPGSDGIMVLAQPFGCAVPADSELARRRSLTLRDLDGLRVMAHSTQENPGEELRLRTSADAAGAEIDWIFRRFSEHSSLIADSLDADGVLTVRESAVTHLPGWHWLPMDGSDTQSSIVRTWAVWRDRDLPGVEECLDAMRSPDQGVTP
ncbi:LysR family transcriptional regulator [Streptomyces sp. NPDC097610]|uniref:LysR family transcriptional regulator n=1 Tax=Streptomyces sp. NPDC097610 TaxID=3157227 RepID=UPI003329B5D4